MATSLTWGSPGDMTQVANFAVRLFDSLVATIKGYPTLFSLATISQTVEEWLDVKLH
jgi:hypothetical protein